MITETHIAIFLAALFGLPVLGWCVAMIASALNWLFTRD